jgi:hypothetical protein
LSESIPRLAQVEVGGRFQRRVGHSTGQNQLALSQLERSPVLTDKPIHMGPLASDQGAQGVVVQSLGSRFGPVQVPQHRGGLSEQDETGPRFHVEIDGAAQVVGRPG